MSQRTARVPDGSRRVDIVPRPPSLTRDVRLDIAISGKVRVRDARRSAIRVLNDLSPISTRDETAGGMNHDR